MKRITRDAYGRAVCPVDGGTQFVSRRTWRGIIFGGFLLAPKRLRCLTCSATLKSG